MSELDQTVLFEQFVAARTTPSARHIPPGCCSNAGSGPGS